MTRVFLREFLQGNDQVCLDARHLLGIEKHHNISPQKRRDFGSVGTSSVHWKHQHLGRRSEVSTKDSQHNLPSIMCSSVADLQHIKKKIPRFNSSKLLELIDECIEQICDKEKCIKRRHSKISVWCFGGDARSECFPHTVMLEIPSAACAVSHHRFSCSNALRDIKRVVLIRTPIGSKSSSSIPHNRITLPVPNDTLILMSGNRHKQRHFILPRYALVVDQIPQEKLHNLASLFDLSPFDVELSLGGLSDDPVAHLHSEMFQKEHVFHVPQNNSSDHVGVCHFGRKTFILIPCLQQEATFILQSYSPLLAQAQKSNLIHEYSANEVEYCELDGGLPLEISLWRMLTEKAANVDVQDAQVLHAFAKSLLIVPRVHLEFSQKFCHFGVERQLHDLMLQGSRAQGNIYSNGDD
eukprot:CAMPEP_0117440586 /NCGR_PEP_ID=MMETSP0759-20121206/3174_1 /TAXON_ID=63605 /ORGANISM="Percolomonas cosmopolitus, Strain WS" /LENGTH=409 /DNA_ID=CAMNT_0005232371 /DNA_START=101 /DNA_END=1327 /DNA_ORIENTATION=-